jgi:AMP phosphorylase
MHVAFLKVKIIDITADYPVVILHPEVAKRLDVRHLDRMELKTKNSKTIGVLDTSMSFVDQSSIGIFKDTAKKLNVKEGEEVNVNLLSPPKSIQHIIDKIKNKTLTKDQIYDIIKDINRNALSETELSAFITSCYINGLNMEETIYLCNALTDIGDKINFQEKMILDKHSIGGINGRVSMILTPIIASLGYKIPKTASRSITSAAGTADAMEVLAPVSFTVDQIKDIISRTNGVVAWEGKFDLCPVDNKLIDVEHALGVNPEGIMIASILSKKKSIGSTHLVIDIPVGNEVKVKDKEHGLRLAKKFISIGKSLGIKVKVTLTDGEKPCGRAFGPALEAKEVLCILENKFFNPLADKSCALAGELLELVGKAKEGEGYAIAKKEIESKRALNKFKEIIKAQGGSIFESSQIPKAKYKITIKSQESGKIRNFDIHLLTKISRYAGAPHDITAGVELLAGVGDNISKGNPIFEIHSNSEDKLNYAKEFTKDNMPVIFEKMIIDEIE